MKDLFGQAIFDFYTNNYPENLITETNISEPDEMEVSYLFRTYKKMPKIEQKALQLCKGNVLDVGCGAGSHALYLQDKKFDVLAIDVSKKAVETCKLRGLINVKCADILELKNEKFDTILLLMNGTGIFGKLNQIPKYLLHLKSILNENGQILIDSSDIIYMFDQDQEGAYEVLAESYYGELDFSIQYKNQTENFTWLYLDYNTLQNACHANALKCELLIEGNHFDYLARIY